MTQDFDKTMDELLRQHGRRGETRPVAGASAHLEPDELNAFAENVLPPAARLRYAAHLADCGACRRLATELTLAAGATFQEEAAPLAVKPPTVTESAWRVWLRALFAPATLRYAVPAVLLLTVSAGAFLTFRNSPQPDRAARSEAPQVAQQPADTNVSGVAENKTNAAPQPPGSVPPANADGAKPGPPAPQPTLSAAAREEQEKPLEVAKNEPLPATERALDKDVKSTSREQPPAAPSGGATAAAPPPGAAEAQPTTQPAPVTATGGLAKTEGPRARRDLPADRMGDDEITRAEGRRANEPAAAGTRGPAKPAAGSTDMPAAPKAKKNAGQKEDDANLKAGQAPETRAAGGRTFIRRGNAWVDTACANGCATTTLKRGSGEYKRADAGLRAIADQLGGEVVVLWQGKAYRIQ
jgi:hypothetical protein